MENLNEITDLLYKHIREELSAQESIQLQNWVNEKDENRIFFERASDIKLLLHHASIKSENLQDVDLQQAWNDLKKMGWESSTELNRNIISFNWRRIMTAASIILLISVSGYWWWNFKRHKQKHQELAAQNEKPIQIVPGSFKARLTLADGSVVFLHRAAMGKVMKLGGMSIENKNGQLVYDGKTSADKEKNLYNTLTTGRGESYSVVLADGTKVWLNAASSVHYPLNFPGNERMVNVEGEAYFKVAKNPEKPFIVRVNGMEIKVLGSVFNVKAYKEENKTITTLLEGKVQLTKEKDKVFLAPGEQGELLPSGALQVHKASNIDKVVGWQKGLFVFDQYDVEALMNELARWYDVHVVYKGKIKDKFTGLISRNVPLSVLLKKLEKSTVHFKIEDRTITVAP
jgi:ferric-dicitrate binding protein FerR (iron transport regulator)